MKSFILFSGGVDSTTALAIALDQGEEVTAVSFVYGQNHQSMENEAARKIAEYYQVSHRIIDVTSIFQDSHSSLYAANHMAIPKGDYASQTLPNTEIEFRNGVFLAILTSIAQQNDASKIYFGAHQDDSGTIYPDCSPEFIRDMGKAIDGGSGGKIHLVTPFAAMTKTEIVREGIRLGVPYELTYSCYEGTQPACGQCGTCIDRHKAFKANGLEVW